MIWLVKLRIGKKTNSVEDLQYRIAGTRLKAAGGQPIETAGKTIS
jgi:hypothetical protein